MSKERITIERIYIANITDIWDLWTTKEGLESWWGPAGFSTEVLEIDLRPGGVLRYEMTAVAEGMVEFMKNAGMPLTVPAEVKYTQVTPPTHLAYVHLADFIPGVDPYDVATQVDFTVEGNTVKMVLTFDAMHDEAWTQRATMGHESQLSKLDAVLAKIHSLLRK